MAYYLQRKLNQIINKSTNAYLTAVYIILHWLLTKT